MTASPLVILSPSSPCHPERSEAESKDPFTTAPRTTNPKVTQPMRHLRDLLKPAASLTLLTAIAAIGLLAAPRPAQCQDDSLQNVRDGGVLRFNKPEPKLHGVVAASRHLHGEVVRRVRNGIVALQALRAARGQHQSPAI